jgi:hypothetical protein
VLNTQEEDKLLVHDNEYEDSLEASDLSAALDDAMVQISVSEMNVDLEPQSELMEIASEATRKLDTHERLNQRSAGIIPPILSSLNTSPTTAGSPTEAAKLLTSATAAPPPPTATGADSKAATATNVKDLGAIPKKTPIVTLAPQEANAAATYDNAQGNPSPAAGPSKMKKPLTAAKGTKRANQSPSSSFQRQVAAYSKVASVPKNFLIPVYRTRDHLVPFDMEEEFCTFRDTVRAAIWSDCSTNGANPDLLVNDWSYRRSLGRDGEGRDRIDGIRIIYCTSAVRQLKVTDFIDSIGLGIQIIETPGGPPDGMKMSFRKPQFGPQDIAAILTAIFKCNGLKGPERCGNMEERTDTPRAGSPFRVCTVHFPEDVVQYARGGRARRHHHVLWEGSQQEGQGSHRGCRGQEEGRSCQQPPPHRQGPTVRRPHGRRRSTGGLRRRQDGPNPVHHRVRRGPRGLIPHRAGAIGIGHALHKGRTSGRHVRRGLSVDVKGPKTEVDQEVEGLLRLPEGLAHNGPGHHPGGDGCRGQKNQRKRIRSRRRPGEGRKGLCRCQGCQGCQGRSRGTGERHPGGGRHGTERKIKCPGGR